MTLRERLRLLIGFVVSLLIHAFVLTPLLIATLRTPAARLAANAQFEEAADWRELPTEKVPLGIERGPASTLTWVGHETYEEHLAERAEFEQAAFTEQAAMPNVVAEAPTEPMPPAPPTEAQAEPAPTELPTEAEAEPAPEPPAAPEETVDLAPAEPPTEAVLRPQDLMPLGNVLARIGPPVKPIEAPPAPKPSPPKPTPQTPATPATPPAQPVTAEGAEPTEEVGEVSDLESDPSSTIDVPLEDLRLGRPIARAGLELKPKRPKFTTLTSLTAAPCNPLVEIDFAKTGIPLRARMIEGSCDARIDHAIKNSLYRWRAKGKPLEALGEKETHTVRLRIVLSSRKR